MSLKYEMEDETPDDIIAEIRGRDDLNGDPWLDNFHIEYGEYGGWDGLELLKAYGERFAAAVKRERETATQCTGLGDAAKLREALEAFQKWHDEVHTYIFHSVKLAVAVDAMKDALSAPPRNCDVGTAEEQLERHRREVCDEYENSWEDPRTQCNGNCKACVAKWLLAPAGQGGGK